MKPRVACICGSDGFPYGYATTNRMISIGKAVLAGGMQFSLWHWGFGDNPKNTETHGVYEGIDFAYATRWRPRVPIFRRLVHAFGALVLIWRLFGLRRKPCCVYIYLQHWMALVLVIACRAFRIPIVQEIGEWLPAFDGCSRLMRWYGTGPLITKADGALVVSHAIEERVKAIAAAHQHTLHIQWLPVILDIGNWAVSPHKQRQPNEPACFLWCGSLGYQRDVVFLLQAFKHALDQGLHATLILVGTCPESTRRHLHEYAASIDLAESALQLTGYVDNETLRHLYTTSDALLMPLWNDERSITRLPSKSGEYLASGRPMIVSAVGDLTVMLRDGESAFMAEPGNVESFASKMVAAAANPDLANRIGLNGRRVCEELLDHKKYVAPLTAFFLTCMRHDVAAQAAAEPEAITD